MGRKSGSKRQASLDARKQILKVRGDYMELSDEEDDDEVVEITELPVKKYKVTARKSDGERNVLRIVRLDAEPTLDLEVWTDDLSPAQIEARKQAQSARDSIQNIIDDILKENDARLVTSTPHLSIVELSNLISVEKEKKAAVASGTAQKIGPGRPAGMRRILPQPLVKGQFMDHKTAKHLVVNTLNPPNNVLQPVKKIEAPVPKKKAFLKGLIAPATTTTTLPVSAVPPMIPLIRKEQTTVSLTAIPVASTTIPTKLTAAAVVDLTSDDSTVKTSASDSKEVSINKLQGKTYPSLVVVARPSLNLQTSESDTRQTLDRKVKRVLVFPSAQFAEYLIQQGLVKSEHYCQTHATVKLKLGMYSDASRFPNSGGYIWISECCPPKFLSVFHGSIFEGNQTPTTNFKLIYHWACQTNVQNVLQWVKVENVFLKGLYTSLRGVCTVALHTHFPILGGKGVTIEVGVISLGTTTHDGANRHVKVEVLGVLETNTKRLMLRAVDPNDTDPGKTLKKRFSRILEPLLDWVNPESTLVIDMTIEKQMLQSMGFRNIARNGTIGLSNQTIMDYLRRIVPRMFQNTLSLLSRPIIQQFLDELVWREMYGTTAFDAFHSIQKHISEQTRVVSGSSLLTRLNKVAANPFKRWSIAEYLKKPTTQAIRPKVGNSSTPVSTTTTVQTNKLPMILPRQLHHQPMAAPRVAQIPKQLTSLEPYYYGTVECQPVIKRVNLTAECPVCKMEHKTNTDLMLHIFRHVSNAEYFCKYCLMDCGSKHNLYTHLELKHATETKAGRFYNCLICHDKFNSVVVLGKHMSIEHSPSELPYHCLDCDFKTSSHKIVIDHFYKYHKFQGTLQCPFCLQITDIDEDNGIITKTVLSNFLHHLKAHTKKTENPQGPLKKCARCDLQFLTKAEFDHHADMHICYKKELNFVPYPESKSSYMVPKSLRDEELKNSKLTQKGQYSQTIQKCSITFTLPDDCKCKECGKFISSEPHFKDVMFCTTVAECGYQTMCKTSMLSHKMMCSLHNKRRQEHPLEYEMFCVCGFSTWDGNVLAGHLAICGRKSAYPSAEEASKAVANPDMLDSLGLMRKDESKDPEEVNPTKTRPETRRRKRKWKVSDVSGDEDADDPDYSTSDEDFRIIQRKRRKATKKPLISGVNDTNEGQSCKEPEANNRTEIADESGENGKCDSPKTAADTNNVEVCGVLVGEEKEAEGDIIEDGETQSDDKPADHEETLPVDDT